MVGTPWVVDGPVCLDPRHSLRSHLDVRTVFFRTACYVFATVAGCAAALS